MFKQGLQASVYSDLRAVKAQEHSTALVCLVKAQARAHTSAHCVSIKIIPYCFPQSLPHECLTMDRLDDLQGYSKALASFYKLHLK